MIPSTDIPLSREEVSVYTPDSLRNIVPTPAFRFRAATGRDQARYSHILAMEGLNFYQQADIRAAILNTLKANWSDDAYAVHAPMLETFWEQQDQDIAVDADDVAAVTELGQRCIEVSPLLRRMNADNQLFMSLAPGFALGLFLCGWSNLETPFRLEAGQVPFDTIEALRKEIEKIERKAAADKVEGANAGIGFIQLTNHAFALLNLTADTEKNSDAPSPSSETQDGSKAETNGASKPASEPSSSQTATTSSKPSRAKSAKS